MPAVSYCPRCLTTFRGDEAGVCPNLSCAEARPSAGWGVVLQPGDLIDRHYRIDRVLAVGGAGLTYLCREVGVDGGAVGPELAVKVLYTARASGAYLTRLATEAQILQELAHENIVQCRGFVHRAGHEPYLVTLFEHGGSLSGHLRRVGPLPAAVAFGVLRQVLLGLDVAHQRGVVHRDLKPDNVLLAAPVAAEVVPQVRVADFGIAKVAGGLNSRVTKLGAFVGTPEYAAPEQFEQQPATAATDVFACGGLLHFMLTAEAPVNLSSRGDIEVAYAEVLAQLPPAIRAAPGCSPVELAAANEILFHTMAARPEHRWTAHQVIAALQPMLGIPGLPAGSDTLELTREPAPRRGLAPPSSAELPLPGPRAADEVVPPRPVVSALPVPSPAAPTLAPADLSQVPAVETTAPPRRSGPVRRAVGAVVGLLGMGAVGVVALAGLVVALLVVGWFGYPWVVDALTTPVALTGHERQELQAQVQRALDQSRPGCAATGRVMASVTVRSNGAVGDVVVERSSLRDPEAAACAADRIGEVAIERRDGPVSARLSLQLR